MKKVILSLFFTASTFCVLSQSSTLVNQLSAKEKKEGWKLLFDGRTSKGWHLYNKGKTASAWVVKNGELKCDATIPDVEREDLVTDKEFENFDLKFEWKISKEGNSGVFINVVEREDIPKAWASGPEYQLLEKSHHDYAFSAKKRPGCLYGFYEQKNPAPDKPVGQWNQSEIKQVNGKIEFYLNGILTASEDLNSENWKTMVANSGFKTFPEFGKHTKGLISLQDWSKGISFRNIKIKEL
ncbi:protein of unknown function [Pseudarcicella hirudinis]|uniref:3-keto-alpha-glucoside-1,2-lyase/3-keto-2-hydroxy-glucal hydratase domain-containing protein n=1 Tax=Pseudarcicella hirudinis TaxID=1079859 RepID=A0A1I5RHG6_9BACT|nr:DUF1080 domain-containing protein [Pseudarcicella hirudinis]SFP58014.1 protein of unknown function [Pseudarcicella hirudinis]